MSRLAQTAKRIDPTRLISAACLVNEAKLKIEDRLVEFLDVIGLNEYYGWYRPNFEDLITLGHHSNPNKPVIITETGADALAGHHGSQTDLFTEEHMAEVYRQQIQFVKRLNYVKGFSPWILYDFRTPRRLNRYQRGYNRKGLIAADKSTRKQAFFILQAFYEEKKLEAGK
jgi:beta-glucuronidase